MSDPTPEQMNCGYAQHGFPAICTCGTCTVVEDGCGCIFCDIGLTPKGEPPTHRIFNPTRDVPCTKHQ